LTESPFSNRAMIFYLENFCGTVRWRMW